MMTHLRKLILGTVTALMLSSTLAHATDGPVPCLDNNICPEYYTRILAKSGSVMFSE